MELGGILRSCFHSPAEGGPSRTDFEVAALLDVLGFCTPKDPSTQLLDVFPDA